MIKYFIYTVVGIVALTVIVGFFIVGSPKNERARRFDEQRIQSLQMIQNQIGEFYRAKGRIPNMLSELNDEFRGIIITGDPETNKEYEYAPTGQLSFELCAIFNRPSFASSQLPKLAEPLSISSPFGIQTWEHKAGRQCFARTIDKDFFKPFIEEKIHQ